MTVPVPKDAVIAPGSLILVTGITAYIGAHVGDQLLQRGYRVRGVVRNLEKAQWLVDRFDTSYGKGAYEACHVPDLSKKGALDEAMKGASGVIHLASDVSFNPDPQIVIPPVVAIALNAVESAAHTSTIKRFVLTSSSFAAIMPKPNDAVDVTQNTFNEDAVKASKAPGPYGPERSVTTYAASKVLAEQAVRNYVTTASPPLSLEVNYVLPDFTFGAPLSYEHQGLTSSAAFVKSMFEGDMSIAGMLHPQHYVDVRDVAMLHVAALLSPGAKGERIFGFAGPKNNNAVLSIFRKLYPGRQFPEDIPDEGVDMSNIVDKPRAEALLKWIGKKDGWTSLEASVKQITELIV